MKSQIVLLCDSNFLAPTVGAALAARAQIPDTTASVTVFVTDVCSGQIGAIRDRIAESNVQLKAISIEELSDVNANKFNKTHVPTATMARLWVHEFLDADCEKFLYLDGDVDITGPLEPLLDMAVPARGFLAAPDLPLLIGRDWGRSARASRAYLQGLGLNNHGDYFNAGVLLVDRHGWREIAGEAWEYFRTFPERCKYHDQSALNATAQSHRGRLSLRWNYQTDFMAVADPRRWDVVPTIWHFTGFPKPWHSVVFPWNDDFGISYKIGSKAFEAAGINCARATPSSALAAGIQQRNKLRGRLRWLYPWRKISRARIIRAELNAEPTPGDRAHLSLDPQGLASTTYSDCPKLMRARG